MTTYLGKKLLIRFSASAFRKLPSIYVFSYFPFDFEGRMWDLIVSVPDHCLSFYFASIGPVVSEKIFEHTHTHTQIYIHTYTHTQRQTYIHTYIHTHTHTQRQTDIHTYIQYIHTSETLYPLPAYIHTLTMEHSALNKTVHVFLHTRTQQLRVFPDEKNMGGKGGMVFGPLKAKHYIFVVGGGTVFFLFFFHSSLS